MGYYFNSRPSARGDALRSASPLPERFQFTPLREGRHIDYQRTVTRYISIHAPPRGATPHHRVCFRHHTHFNSRPSARGDVIGNSGGWLHVEFQFTPLREGRLSSMPRYTQPRIFQFTPLREGRRYIDYQRTVTRYISIHAPPRGATRVRQVLR